MGRSLDNILKEASENSELADELQEDEYERVGDDNDDNKRGPSIIISFKHGDAFIMTTAMPLVPVRFRSGFGGGGSERTRIALMLLAHAIELDNKENPQKFEEE